MPTRIEGAKIACIAFNLNKFRCAINIQVTIDDPKALAEVRNKEVSVLKERVDQIIKAGANVIMSTLGIDTLA